MTMPLHLTEKNAAGVVTYRADAIDAIRSCVTREDGSRIDASEAVTFARELLRVKSELFEQRFPEFLATSFGSRAGELTNTDEHWTYQNATQVGKAEARVAYGNDAPRADVYFEEATPTRIIPIVSSYGFTFQEARISATLGKQLPERKAMAARRAIAQEVDEALSVGKTIGGTAIKGLINQSGTATYATPVGSGGSKAWSSKTPQEIYADMTAPVRQVDTDTNNVEKPNELLLPSDRYMLVKETPWGLVGETTILQMFQRHYPEVRVRPWWRLNTVSGVSGSGKRMIHYDSRKTHVEYGLPVEFEQMAPVVGLWETVVGCHARVGGYKVYFPKSMCYGDEI